MNLTPSQQKALTLDRHLAIVANAGSGKTFVLVRRYVDMLEQNPKLTPRNIVAITFTESAAAELRERIIKEIERREKETASDDLPKLRRYASLRDQLPGGYLGTIHSFASRLLRAYPVEANIDAQFGVLQGADQEIMVEEAIATKFYDILKRGYDEEKESGASSATLRPFRMIGRKRMIDIVRSLLKNRMRVARLEEMIHDRSDEEVIQQWLDAAVAKVDATFIAEVVQLAMSLRDYLKSTPTAAKAEGVLSTLTGSGNLFSVAAEFKSLVPLVLTKGEATPVKNAFDYKRIDDVLLAQFEVNSEKVIELRKALASLPSSEAGFREQHQEYLTHTKAILEIYRIVLQEYEESKAAVGVLDFDDLIIGCEKLLSDERIRVELQEQFQYVMIDEFQDTDETQFEIAKLITGGFGNRNTLAIVGDPKQSIYGFRNAEVSVFNKTKAEIIKQTLSGEAKRATDELLMSESESQGLIELLESFRMAPRPLAVINRVFSTRMKSEGESAVAYSDLVHGRVGDHAGSVEWLITTEPEEGEFQAEYDDQEAEIDAEDAPELKAREAELIAARIAAIVSEGSDVLVEGKDGALRQAQCRDIALLMRSRNGIEHLERALRSRGIPFQIAKGVGFFVQQEVQDMLSYLRFVCNPTDDIALVAVLRSPMFGWSDLDLFRVAEQASATIKYESFWDRTREFVERSAQATEIHRRTIQQLEENLTLSGRIGSAPLLTKIIDETGLRISLRAMMGGSQMIANLEKLVRMARAQDTRGFRSIHDFVALLTYLTEQSDNEAEAEVDPTDDAVQIMTVHGAKGLEWPIVILPFLTKQFNHSKGTAIDRTHGIAFATRDFSEVDFDAKPPEKIHPMIYSIIQAGARAKEMEEEERILYVAMTRARDHLILSAGIGKRKSQSYFTWLQEVFGDALANPEVSAIPFEAVVEHYPPLDSNEPERFEIPIYRSDIWDKRIERISTESTSFDLTYFDPVPLLTRSDRFSATQFLTHRECPTKYYLAYVLGMPEEPKLAYDLDADELAETVKGQLAGQVIHNVFEKVTTFCDGGSVNVDAMEGSIARALLDLRIDDAGQKAKLRERVIADAGRIATHTILDELRAAPTTYTEFRLQTPINPDDQLLGIIDRLYKSPDARWTILDYKTDTNADPSRRERATERYHFQLSFYAYLVHKFDPTAAEIRALIYYTHFGELKEFVFSAADLASIEEECKVLIESIRTEGDVKDLMVLHRNYDHCPDCAYFDSERGKCIVEVAALT